MVCVVVQNKKELWKQKWKQNWQEQKNEKEKKTWLSHHALEKFKWVQITSKRKDQENQNSKKNVKKRNAGFSKK